MRPFLLVKMDQYRGQGESDFQATDLTKQFRYKSGISENLTFERVNDVAWKLTDGTMTTVPASHGQWGGYRLTQALAWVIDVGPDKPAWIARHKDQCSNPTDLREAKAAAIIMAKGACGDYVVRNPIAHLNGLTAHLLERE